MPREVLRNLLVVANKYLTRKLFTDKKLSYIDEATVAEIRRCATKNNFTDVV